MKKVSFKHVLLSKIMKQTKLDDLANSLVKSPDFIKMQNSGHNPWCAAEADYDYVSTDDSIPLILKKEDALL